MRRFAAPAAPPRPASAAAARRRAPGASATRAPPQPRFRSSLRPALHAASRIVRKTLSGMRTAEAEVATRRACDRSSVAVVPAAAALRGSAPTASDRPPAPCRVPCSLRRRRTRDDPLASRPRGRDHLLAFMVISYRDGSNGTFVLVYDRAIPMSSPCHRKVMCGLESCIATADPPMRVHHASMLPSAAGEASTPSFLRAYSDSDDMRECRG